MKRMLAHSHHHGDAGFTDTDRGIRVLDVRHELLHHLSALVDVTIHADPYTGESSDPFHDLTAHHFQNVEKA